MIKNIAFIGATGQLGNPVLLALHKAGFEITALVRNPEKAKSKIPHGIKFIKGNMQSVEDLEKLLEGQDAIYLNLSIKQNEKHKAFHTESDGIRNLLKATQKHQLKRIALISSLVMNYQGMNGFHWWAFEVKHQAVKLIKESGIPYTIFYPSTFMDVLPNTYKQGKRMLLAGKSKHKMWFVCSQDFARMVTRSFQILKDENKEYSVQGPEAFTDDEAVAEFIRHYKKEKLSIMKLPLGVLKFMGRFSTTMNYGAHIIEAMNEYPEPFVSERSWAELGKPEITLKTFSESFN
ncbi:MAG TPA: SDR family oxidoreductase [Cyclobacteriaceae bacterium]|nr:SDR family oxidoreductase [Cyclobacteriaceae bacterium]